MASLVACFVIGLLAQALDLPERARDLSPFQYIPHLPATDLTFTAPILLLSVAAALTAAGWAGLRRRDVG